jgi:hypothetical protein
MNMCRISRKGSGVVFGQAAFHVIDRCPKTTPDPVAYCPTKSDYCFAGLKSLGNVVCSERGSPLFWQSLVLEMNDD